MTFLSDITTIDGKLLLPGVMESTNDHIPKSRIEWPTQLSPDKKTWKLWSQTITSIYCIPNILPHFEEKTSLNTGQQHARKAYALIHITSHHL